MKKIYLFIFILISILSISCKTESSENTQQNTVIKNIQWGMNKSQIYDIESPKKPVINEANKVGYDDVISNRECRLGYTFDNDKLTTISIIFQNFKNEQDKIDFFKYIKEILDEKYKEAEIEKYNFLKDYIKNYIDKKGITKIVVAKLNNKNNNGAVVITYEDKIHSDKIDEEKRITEEKEAKENYKKYKEQKEKDKQTF